MLPVGLSPTLIFSHYFWKHHAAVCRSRSNLQANSCQHDVILGWQREQLKLLSLWNSLAAWLAQLLTPSMNVQLQKFQSGRAHTRYLATTSSNQCETLESSYLIYQWDEAQIWWLGTACSTRLNHIWKVYFKGSEKKLLRKSFRLSVLRVLLIKWHKTLLHQIQIDNIQKSQWWSLGTAAAVALTDVLYFLRKIWVIWNDQIVFVLHQYAIPNHKNCVRLTFILSLTVATVSGLFRNDRQRNDKSNVFLNRIQNPSN